MEREYRYNVENATIQFGTEAIKNSFERKKAKSVKGKGNLDGRETKQVITEMQRYFDSVEIEGKGANRIFVCKGKREQVLDKKDLQNYSNCGQGQMIYRTTLEELILMYLKYGNRKYLTTTTRKLAYEIGAITKEMYELSRLKGQGERNDYHKKLTEIEAFTGVNYSLLFDVVNRETERVLKNIETILDDLNLRNIIYYVPVTNGVIEGERGEPEEHEMLDPLLVAEIVSKQRELREKHNVEYNDLRFRLKDKRVQAYKKEERKYLKTLGYTRIYNTNQLVPKAWDKEIENYFKKRKELKEVFMLEHREFAIKKAKNRNNDFFSKPARVKKAIESFGGKPKPKFNETEYERVFGTNLLEIDYIIQLKYSNIYSKEFGELLRLMQVYNAVDN
ncbi:hypothetical protein CD31_00725 [Lysinibacillus boronitolerans JCM 21713 = 10a = NBRC 103108]|uniref:Uncharacterized protein n=1 Tax=Lysinibacillus boronitolerans JCM 21713 = 10a = NBRC 103108 TaxID=1294264 RepID=A0ABR4Y6G3_9BACI|nr:hypothetical protein CD31_00725 [Lysinibacillus boronitolerans JCM 21713 = 10a = NBRC 103108]